MLAEGLTSQASPRNQPTRMVLRERGRRQDEALEFGSRLYRSLNMSVGGALSAPPTVVCCVVLLALLLGAHGYGVGRGVTSRSLGRYRDLVFGTWAKFLHLELGVRGASALIQGTA